MDELEKLARDILSEKNNRADDSDYDADSGYNSSKEKQVGRSRIKKQYIAAASIPEIDMDDLAERIKERLLKDLPMREALLKNEGTTNSHETNAYHGVTQPNDKNSERSGGITVKEIVPPKEKLLLANGKEENKLKNIFQVSTPKNSDHGDKERLQPPKKKIHREIDLGDKVSPIVQKKETTGESTEYFTPKKFNSQETTGSSAENNHKIKKNKKMESSQDESKEKKYPSDIKKSKLIGYLNEPEKSIEEGKIPKNERNTKTDMSESEETPEDSEDYKSLENKMAKDQNKQRESVENYKPPSVAITQNIDWDDYDENNSKVENMPMKTTLPKKPKYKSSTPDFFVSSATAEPYRFREPIPENDRVPKIETKLKPMIPVKVNGKKVYKIVI